MVHSVSSGGNRFQIYVQCSYTEFEGKKTFKLLKIWWIVITKFTLFTDKENDFLFSQLILSLNMKIGQNYLSVTHSLTTLDQT